MSPEAIFVCYLFALVCFVLATFRAILFKGIWIDLVAAGLALWLFPTFWASVEAL